MTWAAIRAAVAVVISAGLAYVKIKRIAGGDDPDGDKVQAIENELSKVSSKLDGLAKATEPDWDDVIADTFSEWLTELAELLVSQLSVDNISTTG